MEYGPNMYHVKIPINFNAFEDALKLQNPPTHWPQTLQALWFDAKGDWQSAHDLVDGAPEQNAKWVHAYLHRKERDEWNAGYWYRQAGRSFPKNTLKEEFKQLVKALLQGHGE